MAIKIYEDSSLDALRRTAAVKEQPSKSRRCEPIIEVSAGAYEQQKTHNPEMPCSVESGR